MSDKVGVDEKGSDLHKANQITDDDVFKELINIVMDVFANKPEKCLLTFELPVESSVLQEITQELTVGVSCSNPNESGILVPSEGPKLSQKLLSRRRKRKIPVKKSSKYNILKKHTKRLKPVVQTELQPKQSFTDSKRSLRPSKSQRSVARHAEHNTSRSDTHGRDSRGRDEKPNDRHQDDTNSLFGGLCREFKQVLHALAELAHSPHLTEISLGALSYHLEEIKSHLEATKNSLKGIQSKESVDTPQPTSTEGSEAPRRNKVRVKLLRVGAKISRRNASVAPYSKNQRKRTTKAHHEGLEDILRNYQRVKREETEIVHVLLGKLGLCKDRSVIKQSRKRRLSRQKCEIRERPTEMATVSDSVVKTVRLTETGQIIRTNLDIGESVNQDSLKNPQNVTSLDSKFQQTDVEVGKNNMQKNKHNRKHARKGRKHEKPSANLTDTCSKRKLIDAYSTNKSPIILYEYELPVFSKGSQHIVETLRKGKITKPRELRQIVKGDKMIHQIESAAKKLEYMQGQMEKKLNSLNKKQKELNKKISKRIMDTPRGSRSDLAEKNNVFLKGFNSSTNSEEGFSQHYKESKRYEQAWNHGKFSGKDDEPQGGEGEPKMVKNNSCKLETLRKDNTKQDMSESDQSYICNYMMELQDKKPALVPEFSLKQYTANIETGCEHQTQHSNMHDENHHVSSIVLNNELQEDGICSGRSKEPPTGSVISITTKKNEGEIIEESLFDSPNSFRQKARKPDARKKRKRVVHSPLCALS